MKERTLDDAINEALEEERRKGRERQIRERQKNPDEVRERQRISAQRWRDKNREHYRKYQREYQRMYVKRKRKEQEENNG